VQKTLSTIARRLKAGILSGVSTYDRSNSIAAMRSITRSLSRW
jgi:hypothetical protein